MKVTAKYSRPWVGDNANKLIVTVRTPQHGEGQVIICADELVKLHHLFNQHFEYKERGRRHAYMDMRTATARALADYIAQYLPHELKVKGE